jgi:hypothetical protein
VLRPFAAVVLAAQSGRQSLIPDGPAVQLDRDATCGFAFDKNRDAPISSAMAALSRLL